MRLLPVSWRAAPGWFSVCKFVGENKRVSASMMSKSAVLLEFSATSPGEAANDSGAILPTRQNVPGVEPCA